MERVSVNLCSGGPLGYREMESIDINHWAGTWGPLFLIALAMGWFILRQNGQHKEERKETQAAFLGAIQELGETFKEDKEIERRECKERHNELKAELRELKER